MPEESVNQNPSLADVAVVKAAAERLATAADDSSERQERMAERAVSEYEERNRPIDRLVDIDVEQLRAEDKRRRLEKYYGRRGLRQWDSYFAGADTRGNLHWTDEAIRRGKKILLKGGIAGALSLTVAGILGGGVAIPVVAAGVGIGIGARTAWEAGRIAFGKERRERNEIELANQAVIEKILELVDELQKLRVEIASEDATLSPEQIEADSRFKELEIEIIEMLRDDTARRARKVVDDHGKTRYIGLRKGESSSDEGEEGGDVINIGEKEKGLVRTERWLEAGGDILATTATVGASVLGGLDKAVALTEAAKEAARQSGEEAAKKAGEELAKGGPLGPYDFDGAAIPDGVKEHMVKAVEGVRPFFDQLSGVWHDSVENLQGAIGKLAENAALVENIAGAKVDIADLTRSLVGVGVVNLAQFFAGRLGHKNFVKSEAREKKQVERARELIEKIPEIKIDSTEDTGMVDSTAMPEVEERKELEVGWVVEIFSNPQTRERLGIADKFKNFDQFYINKFYNADGVRHAELLPLSKVGGQSVVYKQGGIVDLDAKHLQYPFSTREIVRIIRARLSENETDDGANIVENSKGDSNAGVVRESDSGEEDSTQLRPTEESRQGGEDEDTETEGDNPEDDDGGEDERSRIETEKEELPGTEHTVTIGNFIGNDKSSFICEIAGINRRVDLTGKPSREIYSNEVVKIRIDDNGVSGDQNQVVKAKIIELPEIDSPEDDDSGQEGEEVERVPYVHWGQLLERVHKSGGSVRKIISDSAPEININRVFDLQKHVEKWHVDLSAEEHNELMDLKKKAIIILEKWLSNHQQEASTNDKKQPEAEKPKEQAEKSEDESREEKLRELVKKLLSPGSQWIHSGDPKRSKIKSIDRPEKEIDCAGKVFVLDGINKTDRRWFVEIHQLDQPGDETRLRVEPEKFRQVLMPKSLAEMPDGEEKDQAREILLEEFKKMLDRTPVLNIPDDNDNNGTAVSGEAEAVLPETTEATEESPVDNVGEENNQTGPKTTEEMNQDSSETDTAEGSDQPDSAAPPAELTNGTQENLNTMQQVARTEEENGRKFEQIANVEQLRAGDRIFVRDNTPANVEISTVGGEESRSLVKDFPRKAEFVFNGPAPADFGSGLFEIERKGQKYHLFDTDIIENFEVQHVGGAPADSQEIHPAPQTELNTMRREIDKGIRQRLADEEKARQPIESFPLPIYDEKGEVIALEPNQVWRIVKEDGSSEDLKIIGITRDNNSGILTIDFENQEPVTGSVKEFQEYFGDSELIEGRKNDL